MIASPYLQSARSYFLRIFQLWNEKSCVQLAGYVAGTDVDPGIFVHEAAKKTRAISAFFSDDLGAGDERWIIDHQCSTLSTMDVLCLVKTDAAKIADRPQRSALVARHDSLRRVLHNTDALVS